MRLFSRIPMVRDLAILISKLFTSNSNLTKNKFSKKDWIILNKGYDLNLINKEMKNDGISSCLRLEKEAVKRIFDYIKNKPVFALRDVKKGFYLKDIKNMEKSMGKEILLAQYFNIEDCDVFNDIVNSKKLLKIVQNYIGKKVKKVGTILWWTFPSNVSEEERIKHAHFFHRDVDDYKFLKVFFYLTDVSLGDGTHVFVRKTHKPGWKEFFKEGFRVKRYTDSQINDMYPGQVFEIAGSSGDGFIENTLGFHKGNTPTKERRLVFEITYALNDYDVMNDIVDEKKLLVKEF